jgi:hypothetical protein
VKKQTRDITRSTKELANEARLLVNDVKQSPFVRGLVSLFRPSSDDDPSGV